MMLSPNNLYFKLHMYGHGRINYDRRPQVVHPLSSVYASRLHKSISCSRTGRQQESRPVCAQGL